MAFPATLAGELWRDSRGKRTWDRDRRGHLRATVEWLYRSQDATAAGGSAGAYNLVLGWQRAFPETSGYIVETLYDYAEYCLERGDVERAREADRRAEEMAEWLLPLQEPDGSFRAYATLGGQVEPTVFDTGMITFGLVRQYRETGDESFREAAFRATEWLCDVQEPEGYWESHAYNGVRHTYASRVAWAMLEAARIADDDAAERFREHARRNLAWVCSRQHPNGWFADAGFTAGQTAPFLHTIAYTVRGLLESDRHFEDDRFGETARHTADALLSIHQREGVLKGAYDAAWRPAGRSVPRLRSLAAFAAGREGESTDSGHSPRTASPVRQPGAYYCLTGNAQLAIVWLRLFERFEDPAYLAAAEETLRFLETTQRLEGPDGVRGGIKGSLPVWGRYMYLRYPNWAAKFFADAILLRTAIDGV